MSIPVANHKKEISVARLELKNIRQEVMKLKAQVHSEIGGVMKHLSEPLEQKVQKSIVKDEHNDSFNMIPIGVISSCFKNKNGIPRQPTLCQSTKATLEINKSFFTNPEHSLIGLEKCSYIWILFVFHKNDPERSVKAKVHPPRLDGASVGVFSTRSPHRPCPIGLSLVKLDKIIDNKLFLSGVDLLDGTPVLDIKPYIDFYDTPQLYKEKNSIGLGIDNSVLDKKLVSGSILLDESLSSGKDTDSLSSTSTFLESLSITSSNKDDMIKYKSSDMKLFASNIDGIQSKDHSDECKDNDSVSVQSMEEKSSNVCSKTGDLEQCNVSTAEEEATDASYTNQDNLINVSLNQLKVIFTPRAETNIKKFHSPEHCSNCDYCLDFMSGFSEARQAIVEVLQNDPRSVYRRNKCSDKLYFFEIDKMHVTCWFEDITAEVLRVKPTSQQQD